MPRPLSCQNPSPFAIMARINSSAVRQIWIAPRSMNELRGRGRRPQGFLALSHCLRHDAELFSSLQLLPDQSRLRSPRFQRSLALFDTQCPALVSPTLQSSGPSVPDHSSVFPRTVRAIINTVNPTKLPDEPPVLSKEPQNTRKALAATCCAPRGPVDALDRPAVGRWTRPPPHGHSYFPSASSTRAASPRRPLGRAATVPQLLRKTSDGSIVPQLLPLTSAMRLFTWSYAAPATVGLVPPSLRGFERQIGLGEGLRQVVASVRVGDVSARSTSATATRGGLSTTGLWIRHSKPDCRR